VYLDNEQQDGLRRQLFLPADVPLLTKTVERHGVRLVVIDPLSAHLEGNVDSWKDQSIRLALRPLVSLAESTGAAVLVVSHLNKGRGTDPVQRLGGSIGLAAAARSVLLLDRDPDDPDGETARREHDARHGNAARGCKDR
jgi:RecA-family ATPase